MKNLIYCKNYQNVTQRSEQMLFDQWHGETCSRHKPSVSENAVSAKRNKAACGKKTLACTQVFLKG